MSPILLIGLGVVLLSLGVGLGLLIAHLQRKSEAAKASDIQSELDDYKRQVNEHFGQTAQHFQALGQQYQSLYEHMAEGAQALCDSSESDALPGFVAGAAPVLAATTDEEPTAPEMIRDYAPAEEIQPEPVKQEVETETPEPPAVEVAEEAESMDEPAANDPGQDQVGADISVERERTVH